MREPLTKGFMKGGYFSWPNDPKEVICPGCGCLLKTGNRRRKWCDSCYKIAKKRQIKRAAKKYWERNKERINRARRAGRREKS